MAEWAEATPEQLDRINELALKWRKDARDPAIAGGAAMTMVMNYLAQDVHPDYRLPVIETFLAQMLAAFG